MGEAGKNRMAENPLFTKPPITFRSKAAQEPRPSSLQEPEPLREAAGSSPVFPRAWASAFRGELVVCCSAEWLLHYSGWELEEQIGKR